MNAIAGTRKEREEVLGWRERDKNAATETLDGRSERGKEKERRNGLSPWCTIYTRVHESLKIRRDAMQFISDDHSSNKQLARNRLRAINRYSRIFPYDRRFCNLFFFSPLFFFFFFFFFQFRNFLSARRNRDTGAFSRASKREALIEYFAKDDSTYVSCQFFFSFFLKRNISCVYKNKVVYDF